MQDDDTNTAIVRDTAVLHPRLRSAVHDVQQHVIDAHHLPIQLFETGRTRGRQRMLFSRGKVMSGVSEHMFDLSADPPIYASAVCYVYNDGTGWSWNLRSRKILAVYMLFGELVLDLCPVLEWAGYRRNNVDYTYYRLQGYDHPALHAIEGETDG